MAVTPWWVTFVRTWVVAMSSINIFLELGRKIPRPKIIVWGFGCLTLVVIDMLMSR